MLLREDLDVKHEKMAADPFQFLRATFYRWCEVWPRVCKVLAKALVSKLRLWSRTPVNVSSTRRSLPSALGPSVLLLLLAHELDVYTVRFNERRIIYRLAPDSFFTYLDAIVF